MSELDILEQKIFQAIKLIEKLYEENKNLKNEIELLRNQLKNYQERETSSGDDVAFVLQEELDKRKKKEELIRHKVQIILEKLNKLETLTNGLEAQ